MLTAYSTLTSYSTHTSSSRRRHLPYTHDQRHSPSNEHGVVTLSAGRMETRRGRGEISRQNARADRRNKCSSSSACFRSEERQGEGWRVLAIGGADATRPKEGGARWLKDRGESFLGEYGGGTRAEAVLERQSTWGSC